ncbi:uncharacterized protein LOC116005836 [Ipomoea triloba]|uniref:uncharacterized protein LOC116005836 n=1 Tax=Ipomoea triloba TaxID=35885 RepID=UPI00125D1CE6|nr:uncharacterized protein LOC116005836 [Ipomoea triloba]
MEQVTETLSEENSPAATTRSPEEDDLLQRSTKKTKRGRASTGNTSLGLAKGIVQETPMRIGFKSPESTQWQTPVETLSNAWRRRDNADPLEKEVVSDEESMVDVDSDPNCPVITVTREEKELLRRPWRRTLIVKVLGRKVGYSFLRQSLQSLWKPDANFGLITIDQDYFLTRFDSLRDYEFAKFECPWVILGHYLTVQEWQPNFYPQKNKLNKLLVWVRFLALAIEYFEDEFLMKIGKNIGYPVKADTTTSLVSIGKFARVCVELDVTRPLLSKFTLGGEVVPFEYEGIRLVCFKCGIYGHKQGQCNAEGQNEGDKAADDGTSQAQNSTPRKNGEGQIVYQPTKPVRDLKQNFEGLEENEAENPVEKLTTVVVQNAPSRLPAIRTNQNSHTPRRQSSIPQQTTARQPIPQARGSGRGRGGRGGAPRRAAAKSEHIVNGPVIPIDEMVDDGGQTDPGDAGAVSKEFKRTLKHYCFVYKPDIVCLVEPKVSGTQANSICNSLGFEDWVRVEAVGFSGGIWVLWKSSVSLVILDTHPQFINLQVKEGLLPPWELSMVYGSPNLSLRKKLFTDLSTANLNSQPCWLVCGDFNSVICREEVSNPDCYNVSRSADFVDWIFREGLVDLGYEGSKFTWMQGTNTSQFKAARLDRALSNVEWSFRFPNARVEHLPIINSDHPPLLISNSPRTRFDGGKKFRFNYIWTTHKDFNKCVQQAWNSEKELDENIAATPASLSSWNIHVFGNVFYRKKRILARIKQNGKLANCNIRKIPALNENEWQRVNQPFRPEEVKEALFDMDLYKAPGPDGFTTGFYQKA